MSDNEDPKDLPLPESEHVGSDEAPASLPAPRASSFGEGPEGAAVRRERGVEGARAGFFARTSQFLSDVRAEMKRVSWPTGTDVKNTTIIVVIAVIFFALYLFVIDRGIAFVITQLDHLLKWLTGSP
jgi:preprotein translocase subunit SecE